MSTAPLTRPSLLLRLRDVEDAEAWREFVQLYTPLVFAHCRQHGFRNLRSVLQKFFGSQRCFRQLAGETAFVSLPQGEVSEDRRNSMSLFISEFRLWCKTSKNFP